MGRTRESVLGKKFGRLEVIGDKGSGPKVLCKCVCGTEKEAVISSLKAGTTLSCGCLKRENGVKRNLRHGQTKTKTYKSWRSVMDRCYKKGSLSYRHYGARGIVACAGMRTFEGFYAVLGERPGNKTVDRISNERGYDCGQCADCLGRGVVCNVRWFTQAEQNIHKTNNRRLVHNGEDRTVKEWAEITGIATQTISARLAMGWSAERTLTEAVKTPSSDPARLLEFTRTIWNRIRAGGGACQRIRCGFEEFLKVVGPRSSTSDRLGRDDANGGFWCGDCDECRDNHRPKNCRWMTRSEIARRRTSNRLITAGGQTRTLAEWKELSGLNGPTIMSRLQSLNWTPEQAVGLEPRAA